MILAVYLIPTKYGLIDGGQRSEVGRTTLNLLTLNLLTLNLPTLNLQLSLQRRHYHRPETDIGLVCNQ